MSKKKSVTAGGPVLADISGSHAGLPAPIDVTELIKEMSPKPKELPRVEGELLYQVQVAFHKRDAAQMRANLAVDAANNAEAEWQGFLNVINNKYGVNLGQIHWLDVETGQINEIQRRG